MYKTTIVNNVSGKTWIFKHEQEDIYAPEIESGMFGESEDITISVEDITAEVNINNIRIMRNVLLDQTDKYKLSDPAPLPSGITSEDVTNYRTYLRDITDVSPLPESVMTLEEWKEVQ